MDIGGHMCTPHSGNIYTSAVKILNPALNYIFILQFKYLYLSENISTRCKNIHLGGNISTLVKIFLPVKIFSLVLCRMWDTEGPYISFEYHLSYLINENKKLLLTHILKT